VQQGGATTSPRHLVSIDLTSREQFAGSLPFGVGSKFLTANDGRPSSRPFVALTQAAKIAKRCLRFLFFFRLLKLQARYGVAKKGFLFLFFSTF
jgi:hypothetical protein